ncbi:polyprotein of EF-Ts, chloroplastic-like [Actinidia eriantha]|uniref:polyprotein of EF-Ts, chloroplastic-like n=1 Tax=Actinidia eriantha TaxID=165200 RepID=UPI00258F42A8|nr:polyprotein of EF-Ts, chloroplastic-like [Actinidia eriantha]XP_057467792.1 polyprotein of EF-Ts, chloroplastic-like [Actinidia eriantha]
MTPVISSSINNIVLIPGTPFTTRKSECLKRCNILRTSNKQTWSSQKYVLRLSTSVRLFPQFRSGFVLQNRSRINMASATGTDLAVEQADSPGAGEDSGEAPEIPSEEPLVKSDAGVSPAQKTGSRPARKSEMPEVKPEELVPGATFTGKVKSIQPFGAFIDFGAFTDGLVHVSKVSDSYVKDISTVVSVGQEVKVRLLEANMETKRISLTMRINDDVSKLQQGKETPGSGDESRPPRKSKPRSNQKRDDGKKTGKFVIGQHLEGTVKNLNRAGAFISLPGGEEGFLPSSEESDDVFGNVMGESSLQEGQEVSVRVLRITRGQVTLTMQKDDVGDSDPELIQGVVHAATNPFMLAFRKNKDIFTFLDEREKEVSGIPQTSDEMEGKVSQTETELSTEGLVGAVSEDDETSSKEENLEASTVEDAITEIANNKDPENIVSDSSDGIDAVVQSMEAEAEVRSEILAPEESVSTSDQLIEEASVVDRVENEVSEEVTQLSNKNGEVKSIEDKVEISSEILPLEGSESAVVAKSDLSEETDDTIMSESAISNEVTESQAEEIIAATIVEDEKVEIDHEKIGSMTSSNGQIDILTLQQSATEETQVIEELKNEIDSIKVKEESTIQATISPALVKQLREETGAGMMDCKKALSETGGDLVKAQEFLRKKGLASAEKKASRATAEGRIGSYIHDSRIGVLIEVNCETDFVSRGDIFKELVDDLAMQVAACPQVQYLATEDVPNEIVDKEREIEIQKEDLLSKPEQIRSKIVDGRIRKRLEELALLEQPFIKNDKLMVKDWVKQTIATIGENMKVKRFVRFNLGEGLEKKSQDFAAEVAAQTAAKTVPSPGKEQPAVVEAVATVDTPPKATVSAALVKQLREETGAGMMDCKKALSETGGNLEKAQEYLRKKGLSTADKKSSRLAAEGRIGSYIHDSLIGVLLEVNCETDFVGRSEKFKELVDDLAMQVVACPQVQYVSIEDIPESIVGKEKELEMQREDLASKPENIREKIVEGRISKRLGELALLEQPFIKDDSVLVKDLVKQTVAGLGENIKVRRFVRFTLGETIESEKAADDA